MRDQELADAVEEAVYILYDATDESRCDGAVTPGDSDYAHPVGSRMPAKLCIIMTCSVAYHSSRCVCDRS